MNNSAPALLFLAPTLEASQIPVSSDHFSLSKISYLAMLNFKEYREVQVDHVPDRKETRISVENSDD